MPRGGHSRSGPAAQEGSGRSDRRGYTLTALPSEGFTAPPPDLSKYLKDPSDRHQEVWADLWTTPQACAWSVERWRLPIAADLVKYIVRMDASDAPASYATSIRQLRDDLGLSSAGLKQNGWAVATDEVAERAATREPTEKPERRLRAASDGGV